MLVPFVTPKNEDHRVNHGINSARFALRPPQIPLLVILNSIMVLFVLVEHYVILSPAECTGRVATTSSSLLNSWSAHVMKYEILK